jgi:hypothetical protein
VVTRTHFGLSQSPAAAPDEPPPSETDAPARARRRRTRALEAVATGAVVLGLSAFALHRSGDDGPPSLGVLVVSPEAEATPALPDVAPPAREAAIATPEVGAAPQPDETTVATQAIGAAPETASVPDAAAPPPAEVLVAQVTPKPPPARAPKKARPRPPTRRSAEHARLMAEAKRRVLKGDREGAIEHAEAALALVADDLTAYRMLCANYAKLRQREPGLRRCREYRDRVESRADRAWADAQIERLRR